MNKQKYQTLKGFRDILPSDAKARQWVRDKMIKVAESYGYEPIETPTLEMFELFDGQVGEDEKLYYKFTDQGGRDVALRYDQTVPTARFVGNNYNELTFPFRRYQMQNVFRAEKPQKGRYREFTQFDVDIFGVQGPETDAEVIAENLDTYLSIGFKNPVIIFNSRRLMKDIPYEAIVAIDKLKKIGKDGVIKDMVKKGISQAQAEAYFQKVLEIKPDENINAIVKYLESAGFSSEYYRFEPTLARSFSYSDGPIWEIVIDDYQVGSVGGGERYDGMMQEITGREIPATGTGMGFDRTVEAAQQLGLIPKLSSTQALVTVFSPNLQGVSLKVAQKLRSAGINTEIWPNNSDKLGKQLKYASKKQITYCLVIGDEEAEKGLVTLKDMQSGKQSTLPLELAIKTLNNNN